MNLQRMTTLALVAALASFLGACLSPEPTGIARSQPAATTVKMDMLHRPLPEIPLPNDIATRADPTSPTGRRINASKIAPTVFESRTRELIDTLDGWGVLQPIAIPFTGPLDVQSILDGHRDPDYDTSNDVIYLVNVDRKSPEFGRLHHLDFGQGNYPVILEDRDEYGKNDPRAHTLSLLYEETDEDTNGNGVLDPGEDTDADGVLDVANYLPGANPDPDDLAARADALMTFYERETNTVIAVPLVPLRERTTYAVLVTRRLLDEEQQPVGSPYEWIHHLSQTEALRPLPDVLPQGISLDDVAFAFTFSTQSTVAPFIAVRDGLYGKGVQAHLADQFPPVVTSLLPMRDARHFPNANKHHLMYGEDWTEGLRLVETTFEGGEEDTDEFKILIDGQRYVDYYVVGTYTSPQLFKRRDAEGKPLPLNDQSWPPDLDTVRAEAVPESVYFTLSVPRKEFSARGEGQPAPVLILAHGHTGNRFDALQWSSYFAKFGLAVLAIDGPSHGINITDVQFELARAILGQEGLSAATDAILTDRAFDQNNDGVRDSGVDFWTGYMFHTRDMVRQFTLDYMQLVRILRSFDGKRTWSFDVDGDGTTDVEGLAGDFDGDGQIDVGGDGMITMTGGSLGGMMSMMVGALEPEVKAIAPLVGGGALATIGIRSGNSGARVGFMVRTMSPMFAGTLDPATGNMLLETIVPDLVKTKVLPFGSVTGVGPGDTLVVENEANGQRGCGLVNAVGQVRAVVECGQGDPLRVRFYDGAQVLPGSECEVAAGAVVIAEVDTFEQEISFQGKTFEAGKTLVSLAEGLGLARGSPSLRRMQGLGQLVLDPGDPSVFAPYMMEEPLTYPGTGHTTGSHALMIFTTGDMSVPVSAGMSVARSAGILGYLEADPRYGIPQNQVLIDHYMAESVHNLKRYVDVNGRGVHIDVENFSDGDDLWTELGVPRLDPPLRAGFDKTDPLGGKSAAIFPLTNPEGEHGFDAPGRIRERTRNRCLELCTEQGEDPCGCVSTPHFDIGMFLVNMVGAYLASGGTELEPAACFSRGDCPGMPEPPPARDRQQLE